MRIKVETRTTCEAHNMGTHHAGRTIHSAKVVPYCCGQEMEDAYTRKGFGEVMTAETKETRR